MRNSLRLGVAVVWILSALLYSDVLCNYDEEIKVVSSTPSSLNTMKRYLAYGVSENEGFNSRLDVFIRVANLVKLLPKEQNWVLVLPPWEHLYHWKTFPQEISWTDLFDLKGLELYLEVLEMEELLKMRKLKFDDVYVLQRAQKDLLGERIEKAPCLLDPGYYRDIDGLYRGMLGHQELYTEQYDCLCVYGTGKDLVGVLSNSNVTSTATRSVFVDRFEEVLHIHYGQEDYWEARRSLVFAKHLRDEGDKFRREKLNSTDDDDKTVMDDDWRKNKKKEGSAKGGPYLAVHLRRADFLYAHPDKVPSLDGVVKQIKKLLKKHKLEKVFLATDTESKDIKYLMKKLPLVKYVAPKSVLEKYGDGGIAIIDQWICAHANFFIGTCESTFSFRIHEERDILGFHGDQTFNCLCGDKDSDKCEQPTRWRIVY